MDVIFLEYMTLSLVGCGTFLIFRWLLTARYNTMDEEIKALEDNCLSLPEGGNAKHDRESFVEPDEFQEELKKGVKNEECDKNELKEDGEIRHKIKNDFIMDEVDKKLENETQGKKESSIRIGKGHFGMTKYKSSGAKEEIKKVVETEVVRNMPDISDTISVEEKATKMIKMIKLVKNYESLPDDDKVNPENSDGEISPTPKRRFYRLDKNTIVQRKDNEAGLQSNMELESDETETLNEDPKIGAFDGIEIGTDKHANDIEYHGCQCKRCTDYIKSGVGESKKWFDMSDKQFENEEDKATERQARFAVHWEKACLSGDIRQIQKLMWESQMQARERAKQNNEEYEDDPILSGLFGVIENDVAAEDKEREQILQAKREETVEKLGELFVGACEKGDIKTIDSLLRAKVDVNHNGGLGLRFAIMKNHTQIWKTLLARDDIDINAQKIFNLVCENGEKPLELLEAFINKSTNMTKVPQGQFEDMNKAFIRVNGNNLLNGNVALHDASLSNNVEATIEILKRSDVKINIQNRVGNTPLMCAADRSPGVLKLLLQVPGVQVNLENYIGISPLYNSIKETSSACLQLLLSNPEINVNVRDRLANMTVIMMALARGATPHVKLLLKDQRTDLSGNELEEMLKIKFDVSQAEHYSKEDLLQWKASQKELLLLIRKEKRFRKKAKEKNKSKHEKGKKGKPHTTTVSERKYTNVKEETTDEDVNQDIANQGKNQTDNHMHDLKDTSTESENETPVTKNVDQVIFCNCKCTEDPKSAKWGLAEVYCTEKCTMVYQSKCWKNYLKENKVREAKSGLNSNCPTPDCWGLISMILWKDRYGNIIKNDKTDHESNRPTSKPKTKAKVVSQSAVNKIRKKKAIYNSESEDYSTDYSTDYATESNENDNDYVSNVQNDIREFISTENMDILRKYKPKDIASILDEPTTRKKLKKQKSRVTMSLAEYQQQVNIPETDFQFRKFQLVIRDIMEKFNIKYSKARKLLTSANGGFQHYIQSKDLHRILKLIEDELVNEQLAISEDILERNMNSFLSSVSEAIAEVENEDEGDDIEECTICCEEISGDKETLTCGHEYHDSCIKKWLTVKSECPLCRDYVLLSDEYPSLQ